MHAASSVLVQAYENPVLLQDQHVCSLVSLALAMPRESDTGVPALRSALRAQSL